MRGGNVWAYCGAGWVWGRIEFWVFAAVLLRVASESVGESADSRRAVPAESSVGSVASGVGSRADVFRRESDGASGGVCVGRCGLAVSSIGTCVTVGWGWKWRRCR